MVNPYEFRYKGQVFIDWKREIQRRKGDKVLNHEIGKGYEHCYDRGVFCFFPDTHLATDSYCVKEHSTANKNVCGYGTF